eukprot:GFKZ01011687.1.p1 GENE.GFKZ01011687.1~~GFKZ01011687.1.p1  ORF type:complete len:380 (-),score=49.47 GFKZ01011687.1:977-2116(-)
MSAFLPPPAHLSVRFHRFNYTRNLSRSRPSLTLLSGATTPSPNLPQPNPLPPLIPVSPEQSCGFAALIGPSNSGKSTLLNRLVGRKVAIVTPKVQTTRCRVTAIATYNSTQVIYLDTPGIFPANNRLSRAMVKSAWKSGAQADAVAVVLDVAEMYHQGRRVGMRKLAVSEEVVDVLKGVVRRIKRGHEAEVLVCGNKMDMIPEEDHPFVRERFGRVMDGCGLTEVGAVTLMMSAKEGMGLEEMGNWVVERMPRGNWLYAEDDLTDMPMRLIAAEVTREKVFLVLKQEIPYEIAVETTGYTEMEDGSVRITQNVLVGRKSQKAIVLGAGGAVIKKIGMQSRLDLKEMLGVEVHLILTVKVRAKWKEDVRHYSQWGLDFNA